MRSVWIALGLFFTLWWTWVGFSVLYNRFGVDSRAAAAAVPRRKRAHGRRGGRDRAGLDGDVAVFALSLAVDAPDPRGRQRVERRLARAAARADPLAYLVSAALFVVSIWVPEPLRYVLWAVAIGSSRARCCTRTARRRGARGATHDLDGVRARGPERGAGPAPLRRALRAVPDHPARRGGGRGGPGVGRRPCATLRRLGRAGRGDDPRGRAVVALLRLGGRDQPARCSSSRAAHPRWRGRSSPSGTCCRASRCC